MRARMASLLLAAVLALTPSLTQARVHRRSVGPVILDLGPLPPPPILPGPPIPAADEPAVPAEPQGADASEVLAGASEAAGAAPIYPSHAQPLGALILAFHTRTTHDDKDDIVMTSPTPAPAPAQYAPTLISYHHPTLAEDQALLAPPIPIAAPPQVDRAQSDRPLPRLRGAVIWIWRLLFLAGFGAMLLLFARYRSRAKGQATPKAAQQSAALKTTSAPDIAMSRILRTARTTQAPAVDSLSLLTGNPPASEQTPSAPKDFGLIEPGKANPARTPRSPA